MAIIYVNHLNVGNDAEQTDQDRLRTGTIRNPPE
jgi:hypothetical protein